MAQALPIAKLAGLFIKTLSKPVSKRIKHEFSRYNFTQRILIGIGQTNHKITSRLTIWSAGYRVRSITPLEPEKAMSSGAEFVGESFILLVSGSVVVWEYNRSKEKERKKETKIREEARQQREDLQAKLITLDKRLHALEEVVSANSKLPIPFGKQYVAPTDVVAIDDDDESIEEAPDKDKAAHKSDARKVEARGEEEVDTSEQAEKSGREADTSRGEEKETNEHKQEAKETTLQKRLTKLEEKKTIWERFVWRPW